ncbi:hypothetical protein ACF053_14660 [Streptomyces kanasensis]|uniref:hypothetical protein n=1 Tax=Streptomyces kanasensis TaxID=936756 RepID=UPI0037007BB8
MAHDEILAFLQELDRLHDRLRGHTSELLLHGAALGDHRELSHELLTDRREDGSVEVSLLHRFVLGLTPDYGQTHEVDLVARLTVSTPHSSARVAVDAFLDQPVADLPEGPSVLWERRVDGVGLGEALRFLGTAVEELRGLENPFGPLADRDGS